MGFHWARAKGYRNRGSGFCEVSLFNKTVQEKHSEFLSRTGSRIGFFLAWFAGATPDNNSDSWPV